ncbi:MAG: LysM peptidoglycan-binding domain-containing protein [Bacteroidales bacterium]|nr:LysM peptidoglycan-binding domain-containing protein [Lentimicrobiaceae bacterium]MDD5694008.1 LysM peptidoglycan-binding domain-containing protein [Bacteroidales bacterium]
MKTKLLIIILLLEFLVIAALAQDKGLSTTTPGSGTGSQKVVQVQGDLIEKDTLVYYRNHVVKKKETLYGLSKQFNVSIDELFLLNPQLRNGLKNGQTIKIPVKDPKQFANAWSGTLMIKSKAKKEPAKVEEEIPEEIPITDRRCERYVYNGEYFHVALMLPLYLEETSIIEVDDTLASTRQPSYKAFRFIQFYEGARIALDSLVKSGMNVKLYVYDVAEDIESVKRIIASQDFSKMNLIIGPVFKGPFEIVADLARKEKIPIINPFSRRNDVILDNPWVFKVQPSFFGQLNNMVEYLTTTYPEANYVIIHQTQTMDLDTLAFLKDRLLAKISGDLPSWADREDSLSAMRRVTDLYYYLEGVDGLTNKLSSESENILICVSTQRVFVANILSHLQGVASTYRILLTGMPEWRNYELDLDYAMKLNLHLFTSDFVDFSDKQVKQYIIQFRYRYENEPSVDGHGYEGFDIVYYFLGALRKFGADFTVCLPFMSFDGLQLGFDFHQQGDGGFENEYVHVFKFEDYRLVRIH